MCSRRFFICVFIIGFFVFPAQKSSAQTLSFLADSVSYMWPTNASRQLSSTFAETRSAHLHAGLDIRTWGQEGYPVYATRDGYVHRIGMSPYGYGNVIYLKHLDDSYSVYAHLNRFEPALQAFADSIRFIDYRADIDKIVEGEKIYYKQGDLIAYTGSTGVGPPHLHFELRTPEFKPFNPLLTNLSVLDNIPPVFRQLGIEFYDPETMRPAGFETVNASRSESVYNFGEVTASGPVGLSVNVHDRANQTPNVYAVYSLTMTHESDTLFHATADYFSYRHAGHMFLDRSHSILAQTRRGFQRLHHVKGNDLPFYHIVKNQGILHFDDGIYPITISAADIFGNESTATVNVRFKDSVEGQNFAYVSPYPNPEPDRFINPAANWSNPRLAFDAPLLVTAERNIIPFQRIETPYRIKSGQSVEKILAPNKKSVLSTPDHNVWIQFPKGALYDTLRLQLEVVESEDEIHFHFNPDRIPVDGQIFFNYKLPERFRENSRLALYSVDNFRNRTFFRPSTNSNGFIRAPLREIGSLVLREDRINPWVGRARIDQNLAGNYIIIVPTLDRETAIDHRRSIITVNGQRGIVEYDPEKNFLIFYNPSFRPSQSNEVNIEVFDAVGNRTVSNQTINYNL